MDDVDRAPTGARTGRRHGGGRVAVLAALVGLFASAGVGVVGPGSRTAGAAVAGPTAALAAAPYEYLGWGDPPAPTQVMAATGLRAVTFAFILSKGACNPEWDGTRPLLGGPDAAAISAVRAAGGDVDVSVGGWKGKKLGAACRTVPALTAAYQRVVTTYGLDALDIDIEHTEVSRAKVRERVIAALAALQVEDPGLQISITFGTGQTGPDADGTAMIAQAAAVGFQPAAWTIMPFDFGAPVADMGTVSVQAAQGLNADLVAAYHESPAQAYAHEGISSMNGMTDERDETVSLADLRTITAFATAQHLARLTFWAVNRDRPCSTGLTPGNDCSGIAQAPWAFSSLVAGYTG